MVSIVPPNVTLEPSLIQIRVCVNGCNVSRSGIPAGDTPADGLSAEYPDRVWALDYQFDVTASGKTIKILHIVDEHIRESLSDLVDFSIDAEATVGVPDKIVGQRGRHPRFIRCDNGPELTANALRDWCRFTGAGTSYIDAGAPWQQWRTNHPEKLS